MTTAPRPSASTPDAPAPAETRHVIVDTDTGIDDALALLYLAGQREVSIDAITAVYGNCVLEDSLKNINHVLSLVGLGDVPVAAGADRPMDVDGQQVEPHIAHYVHGYDGLGDVVADRVLPTNLLTETASELLVRLANERPGHYELLTLGPLTNVGHALELDPELLTKFRSITIMGGSGPFPELGATDMFDANIQNDAVAARLVFAAPATRRVMVGVNITSQVITDEEAVVALHRAATPTSTFAADILESYMDFYRLAWGRRVSPVHDGLAAGLMIHPEWITGASVGSANVTFDGFTTRARIMETADGRPVAWPIERTPDTIGVTAIDTTAFLRAFTDALIDGR